MKTNVALEPGIYDAHDDQETSYEKQQILSRVGLSKSVLEVGANSGYFSALLRGQRCCVTAVEMDSSAAKTAEGRADRVIVGDIEDPRVWDEVGGPFDVILFMHVLEHLADPWRVLRESVRFLNPGGRTLVLLPNVACWQVRKELFFRGSFAYTALGVLDRTHLRFFTLDSGRQLIQQAGLEILFWAPTDICVPLERRIRHVPGLRRLADLWHWWMSARFPSLCSEIFLFECSAPSYCSGRQ